MESSESEFNFSDNDNTQMTVDNVTTKDRQKIREKISTLSFEELLKMKEQMGSKLYNKTIFGESKKKLKAEFKRDNKNRPREMSSKVRPRKLKQDLSTTLNIGSKKNIPRDPRFDPLCGQFDANRFKSNYKFINNIRAQEKKQLEEELESCTDVERQKSIKLLIQRTNNQLREEQKQTLEENLNSEEKRKIREKLKQGEKSVFKKKAVKKLENLIEKYEDLKKTNKLQKHIQRRSKKLTAKDRKKLNNQNIF